MKHLFITSSGDWRFLWKALFLIIGTIVVSIMITTLVTITAAFTFGGDIERANVLASGLIAQVGISSISMLVLVGLVSLLVVRVEKAAWSWQALGVKTYRFLHWVGRGTALALTLVVLTAGLQLAFGLTQFETSGFERFSMMEIFLSLTFCAILALVSGFAEEIAFRGYLQSRLMQITSPAWAVLGVAVLFALAHPLVENTNPLLYLGLAIAVGGLFGVVFLKTGSLWPAIALHTVWNFLKTALVFTQNGADTRFFGAPLLILRDAYPEGAMLVELGVIVLAIGMVIWTTKNLEIPHHAPKNISSQPSHLSAR